MDYEVDLAKLQWTWQWVWHMVKLIIDEPFSTTKPEANFHYVMWPA